jgi:hypothetical protein
VLTDDEGANCVEDPSSLAEHIEEYLSNGLRNRTCKDVGRIAHDKAKNNVEQEASNIGKDHGQADSPWSFHFWLSNLFRDVRRSI